MIWEYRITFDREQNWSKPFIQCVSVGLGPVMLILLKKFDTTDWNDNFFRYILHCENQR